VPGDKITVNRTQHKIRPSDYYTQCSNPTWTLE